MTKVSSFSQSNTLSSVTENYFWFLVIFMALFGFVLGGFFFFFFSLGAVVFAWRCGFGGLRVFLVSRHNSYGGRQWGSLPTHVNALDDPEPCTVNTVSGCGGHAARVKTHRHTQTQMYPCPRCPGIRGWRHPPLVPDHPLPRTPPAHHSQRIVYTQHLLPRCSAEHFVRSIFSR